MATRPLGARQRNVLAALQRNGGRWRDGIGWAWGGPCETDRILFSMVKPGFVSIIGQDGSTGLGHYEITSAGTAALQGGN